MENKYTIIDKRYLAEGLAFIGFKYKKDGIGKDAKYVFEDTEQFRYGLHRILELKKELNIFNM